MPKLGSDSPCQVVSTEGRGGQDVEGKRAPGPAALVSTPPLIANSTQAFSSWGLQFLQV